MRQGVVVFFVAGWVIGCGGESQGSKAAGAGGDGGGGANAAGSGGNPVGAGRGSGPPPAQGAFLASVRTASPTPPDKNCPSGAALTFDLPAVDPTSVPPETLNANTYLHKVIDGEDGAAVRCAVTGAASYTVEGRLSLGAKALTISSGTLGADKKGTAQITLTDAEKIPHSLSSPSANCTLDAAAGAGTNYQVKAGSIWGQFSCPSVEAAPSDYCQAQGYFVLENCDQ